MLQARQVSPRRPALGRPSRGSGEASDYKRDRAAACADCADQSCGTCQYRLDAARAYESLATRLQHTIDAAAPGKSARQAAAELPGNSIQAHAAAEREAGQ